MFVPRRLTAVLAGVVMVGATALATSTPASASTSDSDNTSLAAVLTSDGNTFDHNSHDYDILTEAVLAILAAKPNSPVGLVADGDVALTVFAPTDQAFRTLVRDLTGKRISSEQKVFEAVAGLGIDTVETVVLYHVIPGATIDKAAALASDGAVLTTAQGGTLTVSARTNHGFGVVRLLDKDPNAANPRVVQFDINQGNKQIAHGINRVLRPSDL